MEEQRSLSTQWRVAREQPHLRASPAESSASRNETLSAGARIKCTTGAPYLVYELSSDACNEVFSQVKLAAPIRHLSSGLTILNAAAAAAAPAKSATR